VNVCYSCLTLRLHVDCCCDDHRFYWCEQTWELLAVVVVIGMLQLDGLDEYWAHYGAHRWRIYLFWFFLICTRPSIISSLVYFVLDRVGPLLCFMDMLGYIVFHTPNLRTLWIFMYVAFLLNEFYLFIWDVTIIIQLFLYKFFFITFFKNTINMDNMHFLNW